MSADLTAAVLAAIAERRKVAEVATPGPWDAREVSDDPAYPSWWVWRAGVPHFAGVAQCQITDGDDAAAEQRDAAFIAANDPTFALANLDAWEAVARRHKLIAEDYTGMWWTDHSKPPGTFVVTGCGKCRHAGVDGDDYITGGACDDLTTAARLFLTAEEQVEYGITEQVTA